MLPEGSRADRRAGFPRRGGRKLKAAIDRSAGVFETMLMLDGRIVERTAHLRRLAASAEALYGLQVPAGLDHQLEGLPPLGRGRVRVSVWPLRGSLASKVEVEAIASKTRPGPLRLIPATVVGGLGCHKWLDRSWLNSLRVQRECDADSELLLLDSDGEVLETERAALLIVEGSRLVAAPDDARRLPSLTRRRALAAAAEAGLLAAVEPVGLDRLLAADQVLAASSVRLVVAASACGERRWGETGVAGRLTTALLAQASPLPDGGSRVRKAPPSHRAGDARL